MDTITAVSVLCDNRLSAKSKDLAPPRLTSGRFFLYNLYMFKYLIGLFFFVLMIAGAYYLFGQPPDFNQQPAAEPIKIGFVGPLTGDFASYGLPIKNSVVLAVKDLKTQGKLIDVIYEDGQCNGDRAGNALAKLINVDKVSVVIGGVCNGETLAMTEAAEKNRLILFSPSANSADLTNAGGFIFRNNPSDASGGNVLANLLGKKYQEVAMISENTDYAQVLRKTFIQKFGDLGGQLSVDEIFSPDIKDFRSIISKIKNSKAQALIINPQTDQVGGLLVKEAGKMKLAVPIYVNLVPTGPKLIEVAGKAANGVVFTTLPALGYTNPRVPAFIEDYKKTFGVVGNEFYMAAAYDAVNILVQAIESVGDNADKVRDYLYNLPEYDGLIGRYSFDLNGDVVGVNLVLKIIEDGQIKDFPIVSDILN
jgi:branched-chain amino acid transport system substrate-binding protein